MEPPTFEDCQIYSPEASDGGTDWVSVFGLLGEIAMLVLLRIAIG